VSGSYETLDETVLSARLALIALPGPVIDEVIGGGHGAFLEITGVGYPPEWPTQDRHVLGLRKRQISEGDDYRWLLRAVVTRSHPTMVGRVGFHGPPDADGVVEIGYRIDSGFRRRGFGLECAARLIEAAERLHAVSAVRASIAPENEPSLRIAKRLGFRRIGEQMDEVDGLELVFERKAEAGPGRAIPGRPSPSRPSSR
jgi:RimJ/RimL family protein N-acetyltransferase